MGVNLGAFDIGHARRILLYLLHAFYFHIDIIIDVVDNVLTRLHAFFYLFPVTIEALLAHYLQVLGIVTLFYLDVDAYLVARLYYTFAQGGIYAFADFLELDVVVEGRGVGLRLWIGFFFLRLYRNVIRFFVAVYFVPV